MKQITLSIEQMKRLEVLGLDTRDASMIYVICPVSEELAGPLVNMGQWEEGDVYAYTLQDLLNKLPDTIPEDAYGGYKPGNASLEITKHSISYISWHLDDHCVKQVQTGENKTLLDAAYEILVWCLINGYCKNEQD